VGNLIALPLNLIFYSLVTAIGIILLIKTDFLGYILATFTFAFLAIWISSNSILDAEIWFINTYNATSGNFTMTHTVTALATPMNPLLIIMNIGLALASSIILFRGIKLKRDG